jgi:hypothetical protein
LVFPVISFLLAFPPISYKHFSSPPFVLHAQPISHITTSSWHSLVHGLIYYYAANRANTYIITLHGVWNCLVLWFFKYCHVFMTVTNNDGF